MKRFIALLMAIIMCSSLVGCGTPKCSVEGCGEKSVEDTTYEEPYCSKHLANKKAQDIAETVYDMVSGAYMYCEWMGDDVIAAWRTGIYDKDTYKKKDSKDKLEILASKLNLSYADVKVGEAAACKLTWDGVIWDSLTEEEKNEYLEDHIDYLAVMAFGDLFQYCVTTVIEAYTHNGYIGHAQSSLDLAKQNLKTLSQDYPDYIHYEDLKDYYTAVNSYFDFCVSPTGNFEQASNSNNEYQKQVKECMSALELEFED